MARYIITDTQLHSVVYQYMDKLIDREKDKKESPWSDEGYTMRLYDKDGINRLFYAWYAPGSSYDDDDDTVHNGIGHLQVHPKIVDFIRTMFKVRETKALDLIGDWFTNRVNTEVDEIVIHPNRPTPPVY